MPIPVTPPEIQANIARLREMRRELDAMRGRLSTVRITHPTNKGEMLGWLESAASAVEDAACWLDDFNRFERRLAVQAGLAERERRQELLKLKRELGLA